MAYPSNKIYIGDNLEVLKTLNLENQIKAIYIDPPYNTQTNKSYNDRVKSDIWAKEFRLRLELAHKSLREDGVIFISIDDNELINTRLLCDLIFGVNNFIGLFITRQSLRSNAKHINTIHEYIVCYAKDKIQVAPFEILRTKIPEQSKFINKLIRTIKNEFKKNGKKAAESLLKKELSRIMQNENITWIRNYHSVDDSGNIFFAQDLSTPSTPREVQIDSIGLNLKPLKTRGWVSDKRFIALHSTNRLYFKNNRPYSIAYLYEAKDNAPSILNFYSRQGTNDLNKLGLHNLFDTPKPVGLIKFLLRIIQPKNNDTILDFYAGSGTTAQAIYEINKEDNLNLSYILIQKDEPISKRSKTYATCLNLNITPSMKGILKLRIKSCLKHLKINDNFKVIEME